ncbi:carbohydrate-binding protein [Aquimarina agarivorans]|uniref:carbohydrate-binding protein n=1 Tax=Aquimarina agarivorans TaxID=980584 RepID=UPI000248EB98|nr:carbohydrate-binding protein [Aquimarina agarivorans]
MKIKQIIYSTVFVSMILPVSIQAQETKKVTIDLENKRFIGNVSNLSRARYFNMHESYLSDEFNSNNISEEILDKLNVERARAASGPGRKTIRKNGKVIAYPEASIGTSGGVSIRNAWRNRVGIADFNKRKTSDVILVDAPNDIFLPNGNYKKAAKFAENYIKSAFDGVIPKYYEIMNEPFVHTKDFGNNTDKIITQMSELHKGMADHLHKTIPEMLVGGYSSAFPQMEAGNPMFNHWNKNQKKFMDITNNTMDFYATHIYDGANVVGSDQRRQGSNMEAILDLIEAYSQDKFGEVKPHLISEFGRTERPWIRNSQGRVSAYTEARDGEIIRSINAMLMQLFEKPDRLLKAVPFIVAKSNWFYNLSHNPDNNPYPWALLRRLNNGKYTYTHLRKFYELWKDVSGHRVVAETNDPDILAQVFVNNSKAYVAIHNMDGATRKIELDFVKNLNVNSVTTRSFFTTNNGVPKLNISNGGSLPKSISVQKDGTTLLVLNLKSTPKTKNTTRENVYYPARKANQSNVLKAINANQEYTYRFNNVQKDNGGGTSKLRVSFGRAKNASKNPKVTINGKLIVTPKDWIGDDQKQRDRWFGMVEIPFETALLKTTDNVVKVSFPDKGGKISSVVLIGQRTTKNATFPETKPIPKPILPVKNPLPTESNGNLIIEAEDFVSTTGVFDNTIAGGAGLGVQRAGNGINYVNAGDSADYNLSVKSSGVYEITYRITTPSNNAQVQLLLNNNLIATDNVSNNGNWNNYVSLKSKSNINLNAGNHKVKLIASGSNSWQWNLDKVILTKIEDLSDVTKTVSLSPVQDAYLQGESTRFNDQIIRIEPNKRVGYLKFNLSSIKGVIEKAELKFTVNTDAGNGNLNIHKGSTNSWTERNLSSNNKPKAAQLLGTSKGNFGIGNVKTIKLNANLLSGNNVSLLISLTSGNDFAFASKENNLAKGAELVITYESSNTGNKSILESEASSSALVVYPNPVQDSLFLLGNHLGKEIKVFDLQGRQVLKIDAYTNNFIDVRALSAGCYIICVTNLNNNNIFKSAYFVKK